MDVTGFPWMFLDSSNGADGRTRTGTAEATAPSRQRVYLFHHIGKAADPDITPDDKPTV